MLAGDAAEEVDAAAVGVEEDAAVDGGQRPADERLEVRVPAAWPAMVAADGAGREGAKPTRVLVWASMCEEATRGSG